MERPKLLYITKNRREQGSLIHTHSHATTEYVLYLSGGGTGVIGKKKYDFVKNELAVIHAGVPHSEVHNLSGEVIFFNLSGEDAEIPSGVYRPGNFDVLKKIVTEIYAESRLPGYRFEDFMAAKAEEFLILLKRDLIQRQRLTEDLAGLRDALATSCCAAPDIRRIAREFGFEYDRFRYLFKKACGMSPNKFLIYHRLLRACDLLENTDKSCLDIALECNFCDSAQFSKMFKRQFGIAPLSYRHGQKRIPAAGADSRRD